MIYRAIRKAKDEINEEKLIGKVFELRGFTSATTKKDLALDSIKQDDTPELSNILFEFIIEDSMSHFLLDDEKYSAYPCEKEVLL